MTTEESLALVRRYYLAYQSDGAEQVADALRTVTDSGFILDSPLVEARFGGPASGDAAVQAAVGVAPFLRNVEVESLYATPDGTGVAALIHFPSPVGTVVQSEHFDVDPGTGLITRLRSYYDPRKLLAALQPSRD